VRPSFLALLVAALSLLWGASGAGCDGGTAAECAPLRGAPARRLQWQNLQTSAEQTLQKNGAGGPKERRRDLAAEHAAALWTLQRAADLRSFCARWLTWDPANTLAFEYLSKAAQQLGETGTALRAATSIAELAPRDSEQLLRGAWITMALGSPTWARRFAARSLEERNDNPNTYRALALAAWREGDLAAAAEAYARGLRANFHGRYGDVNRVLSEEAALFLRALQASGDKSLADKLWRNTLSVDQSLGSDISLRISLSWLTDANDVDLHVVDPLGAECYYANRRTSLLELYSDQTQGLGPEVVALRGPARAGTYRVGVKYYSAGAMGASRGAVVIWRMASGVPIGQARIQVFTLPSGYSSVLPVADIAVS